MILKVFISTNSKKVQINKISDNEFEIKLKSQPIKGKANKELIEILSEYFNKKKTEITILKGHKSHEKLILIEW